MQRSIAVATAASPETYVVDKTHSEVSFQVRHMLSKTRGRFTDFEGVIQVDAIHPESSSVEFRVRSASVDSDLEQRDQHLRSADFFDAERHPEVVFRSDRVRPLGEDRYEVTGTLSLRGVVKRITLPVSYLGAARDPWGGNRAGFSTSITLNRKDFGMVWNQALDHGGFVLGDQVWVTIELEAIRQSLAA
ncbi:MAG TPA: YceI family protein [Candidatus Eisenbacteria bacterium]|jgi:polyisoprenoid-binding protein YceI